MYLGQIVELSEYRDLFTTPIHPYTQALLSAIPLAKLDVKRERIILEGDVPSPIEPNNACRFAGRCRYAQEKCRTVPPALKEILPGHFSACHYAKESMN
jgi:peptide/nickel transport system ATP-binding protein